MSKSSPTVPAGSSPPAAAPALLGRHEAGLRTYLLGLQGANAAQVDAVIREIMRTAPKQLEFEDDPVVWMFTEGRRQMGGGHRGEVLAMDAAEGARDDEPAPGEDPAIAVHRAFGRLTNKQQEILRLKFQFGFNLAELAHITGVNPSGAGGLLHAAVERIGRAAGFTLTLGEGRGGDVRLTAYALDELEAAQKKAFAESVPDAKALLESSDAIRKIGAQLARVLESGAPLPKRARRRQGVAWWQSPRLWLAAVAVAVVAGLGWYFTRGSAGAKAPRSTESTFASAGDNGSYATRPAKADEFPRGGGVGGAGGFSSSSTGSRTVRPGEAEWERKAFGRGQGGAAGAGGAAAGELANPLLDPAQPGGETGPAEANSGVRSAGSTHGAMGNQGPAAEKRGDQGDPDAPASAVVAPPEPDPAPPGGSSRDAAADQANPSRGSAAPKPPAAGGMKPAAPDTKDDLAKAPATPKEASKIPDKKPQLPAFTPTQRQLAKGRWPKPADVKAAELVKQAPLDRTPGDPAAPPVTARLEITPSPWKPEKQIVRATIKARATRPPVRPAANLVFAIDVSGSMAGPNRLPLVQEGVRLLADRLRPEDRVAVVTYAAQAKETLPANLLGEKALELRNALTGLEASGQTNGYEGLQLAYDTARKHLADGGLNVVILCTDGNFNLGETDEAVLGELVARAAAEGIKLSVFGFGRSDRNDLRLELLATKGGGRSCYVNTSEEAERLLAGQIDGLVETVATEVTLGVAFDPAQADEIVRIDGGQPDGRLRELLSGRSLNALYEVRLKAPSDAGRAARLDAGYRVVGAAAPEHLQLRGDGSIKDWMQLDPAFRFAIAGSEFARILQAHDGGAADELDRLAGWVKEYLPDDTGGYRRELLEKLSATRQAAAESP